MTFPTELAEAAVTIAEGKKALHDLARQDERRKREIESDPDLTTEGRKIALRQHREALTEKRRKIRAKIDKAAARAEQIRRQTHVNRPSNEDGRARARQLLDQGYAFDVLLARAEKYGDDDLAAGLQAELFYLGDGDKFSDEAGVDVEALAAECDRVLAGIARHENERDTSRLLLEIADASRGVKEVDEFTVKQIRGEAKPSDRLKMAYALGPDQQGEPYRGER